MLTGDAGSGKSTTLNTAADILNAEQNGRSTTINIHRVYPGAFDDISTLIGQFSPAGAWEDGVIISLIRKGLTVSNSSINDQLL